MTPVKRPSPACVSRLTISRSAAPWVASPVGAAAGAASACADSSRAIAESSRGSPKILAKPKARMPAIRPTIIPRTSSAPTMAKTPLVAGEAEEVPPVVDEFVYVGAVENGECALLHADEIDRHEGKEPDKDRPRKQLADGDCKRPRYGGRKSCIGHGGKHLLGITRPGWTGARGGV